MDEKEEGGVWDDPPDHSVFHVAVGKQQQQVALTADVLIKIAAGLPVRNLPAMSAVCRGFWDACRDDNVWRERCRIHNPPYEFRTSAEQRILGGWRALYRHRYSILERLPERGRPSMEAQTGDLVEVESGVRCLAVSGSLTVAGLSTGELVIYRTFFEDRDQREESLSQPLRVATCRAHSTWVYSVCCESYFTHADGSVSALVASCSRDQTVRVWVGPTKERRGTGLVEGEGKEEWKERFVLEEHEDWVAHVKMSHCKKRLLSSGNDGKVVLWCLHRGEALKSYKLGPEDAGLWWMELHDTKSSIVVIATGVGNVIFLNYETGRRKIGSVSGLVRENTSSPTATDPCFFSCVRGGTVLSAVNGIIMAANEPRINDNSRDADGNPINTVMTSQRDLKWLMDSEVVETWMLRPLHKRRLGVMLTSAQGLHRFPELPRRAPGSSLMWFDLRSGELLSGPVALPTHKRCMSMQSKLSHFVIHSVDPSFTGVEEDGDASDEGDAGASTAIFRCVYVYVCVCVCVCVCVSVCVYAHARMCGMRQGPCLSLSLRLSEFD